MRGLRLARWTLATVLVSALPQTAAAGEVDSVTLVQPPGAHGCFSSNREKTCARLPGRAVPGPALVVSPEGGSVYVSAEFWESEFTSVRGILVFRRDRVTGTLALRQCLVTAEVGDPYSVAECDNVPGLTGASGVAVSRDGIYVYVSSAGSVRSPTPQAPALAILRRERHSGRLASLGCLGGQPGCDGDPRIHAGGSLVVSPDGRTVYGPGLELERDTADGWLTVTRCATPSGNPPVSGCEQSDHAHSGLVFAEDGRHAYAGEGWAHPKTYDRDPETGALSPHPCDAERGEPCESLFPDFAPNRFVIAPGDRDVYATSLAFPSTDPEGALLAYRRDPVTGVLTSTQCFGAAPPGIDCVHSPMVKNAADVAIAGDGHAVYVASGDFGVHVGGFGVFDRDPETGELSQRRCVSEDGDGGDCIDGDELGATEKLASSPDGRNVYAIGSTGLAVLGTVLGVDGGVVPVSRGIARPRLLCPRVAGTRCRGSVALRSRDRVIGTRRFSLARGHHGRVRVALSRRARRRLGAHRRLRARMIVRGKGTVSGRIVRAVILHRRR